MTLPTLSDEQQRVLDYLNYYRKEHVFITGRAGTGKSVVLRAFREQSTQDLMVAAPTGVAAQNVEAVTLHNLLGMGTGVPADENVDINEVKRKKHYLKDLETLVIDEVSMVSSELMDSIDRVLRAVRNQPEVPFGGVRLIMFGDLYQLPPVKTQDFDQWLNYNGYRSAWFFDAHVWEEADFKTFGLVQVHRQSDARFKELLNAVREGLISSEDLQELNDLGARKPPRDALHLSPYRRVVKTFNDEQMRKLRSPLKVFEARVHRNWGDDDPADRKLGLKAGAKVIMLNNDTQDRWVNGTEALIKNITNDSLWVETEDGITHAVSRFQWVPAGTHPDDFKNAPKFVQFPVRPSWALTVHKAQGLSKKQIVIDLDRGAFEAGHTYVALSRVTGPDGLYLTRPIQMTDIRVDHHVLRFFREMAHA